MSEEQKKLAVLVDADNAQPKIIEALLAEVAIYGIASVKRIYGDWTSPILKGWKAKLLEHSIQPIQQFSYTTGKNSTDSSLIIDAMDLLYTEKLDGFCIVSSDSDFTRLASRIREEGLTVYGFGEKKTPKAFVNACDKFIYTEILREDQSSSSKTTQKSSSELKADKKLVLLLQNAVEASADESSWAYLANVGGKIMNQAPEFDPRNYGYSKLGQLMEVIQLFDIEKRSTSNSPIKLIYVRNRQN